MRLMRLRLGERGGKSHWKPWKNGCFCAIDGNDDCHVAQDERIEKRGPWHV